MSTEPSGESWWIFSDALEVVWNLTSLLNMKKKIDESKTKPQALS
jgi:hypothetical protein